MAEEVVSEGIGEWAFDSIFLLIFAPIFALMGK